jgi:hypothetical protein
MLKLAFSVEKKEWLIDISINYKKLSCFASIDPVMHDALLTI